MFEVFGFHRLLLGQGRASGSEHCGFLRATVGPKSWHRPDEKPRQVARIAGADTQMGIGRDGILGFLNSGTGLMRWLFEDFALRQYLRC